MRKVLHFKSILFFLCLLGFQNLIGQEYLVKDINPGVGWSGIELKFRIGEQFYFTADGDLGEELWVSDGTPNGTVVLKDINPDPFQDSNPANFIQYNGTWYFTADDGVNGTEIWTTDGTTDGTVMFMDIHAGASGADPGGLTIINGTLYFNANDGTNGDELWKSDGTVAGTVIVADVLPGISGSAPEFMVALGASEIAFVANDGTNGKEIWKTDGSAAGTVMIKDIVAGASSSFPTDLTSVADKVYFIANDGVAGPEIWRTDGTSAGTLLAGEVIAGPLDGEANNLNAVGNHLFFVADNGTNGIELFRSDASASPAIELVEIFPDTFGSTPTDFITMNDDLYFNANSGVQGFELWKASAATGSVAIVKDIIPGFGSSSPGMLAVLDNNLIFKAKGEGIGFELWKTDGTETGTVLLGDLNTDPTTDDSDSSPQLPVIKDNVLYFTATDYINGYQIWRTDGTTSSTQRLTSIPHDTIFNNSHKPFFLNNIGNSVINFGGLTTEYGEELWGVNVVPITINSIETNSPLLCNGDTNGSIFLTVTGGVGDPSCFNYSWSEPGLSGLDVSGLAAGSYTITVTDCVGFETISTIIIMELDPVTGDLEQTSMVTCNGESDGQGKALGVGGTAPYSYLWDNAQTGPTVTGLEAGIHSVTITDFNGCTGEATVEITEPDQLIATANPGPVICFGGTDGLGEVTGTGGTPDYTYEWDNGDLTQVTTSLNGGVHTVTITDANGCTSTDEITIVELPQIEIAFSTQDVSCIDGNNGSATAAPIGGSGSGYTYVWGNLATSETVTDLPGGEICVTVTDGVGCTFESCTTILTPSVSISASGTVSCFGEDTGMATVNITNANSTYTYLWDNGETTATATMLSAGVHTVTVTDGLACTSVQTVTITEVEAFVFADSLSASPTCFGAENGFVTFNFSGGTAPYLYNWSTGAMSTSGTLAGLSGDQTYCATVTDAFECEVYVFCSTLTEPEAISATLMSSADASCFGTCNGAASIEITGGAGGMDLTFTWSSGETNTGASSIASNLCVGENFVTITDGTCSVVESYMIGGPDQIVPTITVVDASCFGATDGSVSATAIGGTAPYEYEFSGGETDLGADQYTLVITDMNGCTRTQVFMVGQPSEITASFVITSPSCIGNADGSVAITADGGNGGPYTFEYSDGPEELSAGTYSVTVTDVNMCTTVEEFSISDPTPIAINNMVSNISCFGEIDGSVMTDASGGTGPYTFEYSDGTADLAVGTYMVTATDANGCVSVDSFMITEPAVLEATVSVTNISCFGEADGSAMTIATGGTMPYEFNYENGSEDLMAGMYSVTTTDANGCESVNSFEITEPPLLVVAYAVTDASCFGASDGGVEVTISGGTEPYEFDDNYSDLPAGEYGIIVVDANGCTVEEMVTVGQPDEIVLTTNTTDATGMEDDGTASVMAEGGMMPYTYEWNTDPVQTSDTATALVAGDYMITVTDANGCTSVETVTVGSFVNTNNLDESLRFELYPNPTQEKAVLYLEFTSVKDVDLNVYDALGRKVYQRSIDGVQNEQIELDVEHFAQGIYWIHVYAEDGQYVQKLSVVKR